jgi:putative chitinase
MAVSKINRKFFFDHVRSSLFGGKISAPQVAGMNFILDVWETSHATKDDRWLAYALGTAFHETAFTMRPIKEFGGNQYFFNRYDKHGKNPTLAAQLGNTEDGDGILFPGRGYVQLTGRRNYKVMGKAFDVDLTSNKAAADRMLSEDIAAKVLFKGMEEGVFTGKKFANYFNATTENWVEARKIVNGNDKKFIIGEYGRQFYRGLSYTTAGGEV